MRVKNVFLLKKGKKKIRREERVQVVLSGVAQSRLVWLFGRNRALSRGEGRRGGWKLGSVRKKG